MYIKKTYRNLQQIQPSKIKVKRWIAKILSFKELSCLQNIPKWVQWIHQSKGVTHCPTCLKLDKCWFNENIAPPCPHHPNCHCYFEDIPFERVKAKLIHIANIVNLTHTYLTQKTNIYITRKNYFYYGDIL